MTTASAKSKVERTSSEAVTLGVRVRVWPSYLPDQSDPQRARFVFAYKVRVTNETADPLRLISRKWRIIDADGEEKAVEGEGVVGQQPTIPASESFEYSSFCPLETGWGTMEGQYTLERPDGTTFDAHIARFYLVAN